MYHYYQRSEHDAWFVLSSKASEDPVELAKAQGAKKLTILALNQMVNDGTEAELPRNRDKIGYRGPLYFDIDCKDDLDQAISSGQELVGKLTRMGVPKGCIEIFLSGSKGLHILINELLFAGQRFILRLPEIYKEMARDLFVIGLDFSVYSSGRGNSFRIVNLQRHDGNYRVPVTPEELAELTVDRYREWVKAPRTVEVDNPQGLVVQELRALYEEAKKRVNSKPKLVIIASSADMEAISEPVPVCIQMLCDSESMKADASYNQAATQLATYIVRARVSQSVAESLAARLASSAKSSKYSTPKMRRDHIEAQIRYVEHTPTFSFGCNAIRALLSKRPCEGCAIEGGANKDGDADLSAVAEPDGYYIRVGDNKRRISNFTLQPIDVFIDVPEDGTSPRRVGTRMNVLKGGETVCKIIFKESAFAGRAAFLKEFEGITDLVFQGTDLDIQKIKIVVFREDQDVGEIFQVYTAGIHLDFVNDSPVFTYVEPDMSVNSVKVRGTHQFLGNLLARPYFAHTPMAERGDEKVDQTLTHLLKINQKHEIGMMVGWTSAAHFKTHFMHLFSQFPILCLWGSAGSGKSKTAGLFTWLNGTDYMQKDSGVSAPSTSHYAMLEYLTSTTTIPRIIDEFNKSKINSKIYKDTSERIKQAWNGEATLKGRLGRSSSTMGRTNAEAISIPLSSPLVVISEQEIEVPAIQERSIRVHLTKVKRAHCREHFFYATKHRNDLRRLGKAIMAMALTTSLEDIEALMEKASALLPEEMDDRPRYSLQVILVGLWKLQQVCEELHLFSALKTLEPIIKTVIERFAGDGDGYVQSEIDLVIQKMSIIVAVSRSAEEAGHGNVHLAEGQHYTVTPEYLILDPVLSHASYTRYCNVDERSTPVINSGAQFVKLITEEPYFVKYEPYAGMGGGRPMLFLSLQEMQAKHIDISLLG